MAKHVQTARGNLGPLDRNVVEFDYHIEQRPGRLRYNADDVLRSACKQCVGKVAETPWVDESERADELTEPLRLRDITWDPEVTNYDMQTLQAVDESIAVVMNWLTNECQPLPDEPRLYPLETRTLWAMRAELQLQEGILERLVNDKTQLVVPFTLRKGLFNHVHAGLFSQPTLVLTGHWLNSNRPITGPACAGMY